MSEQMNKVCVNLAQDFTDAQKAQARSNIGAVTAAEVAGRTVYVDWDGTSDKFSDIAAIVAAGNAPVVRYNNYDYVCTDSQDDGRFVFMSSLGEGGVFSYVQFFRGGTPPQVTSVNLALPYHTSSDVGKFLGLVQGSGSEVVAWVTQSGSGLPAYSSNEAGESLVVNGAGDGVEWSRRISGVMYNGSTGVEMRRLRVNSYNDTNTPGLVAAFPVTGQGVSCGTLMPDPDGVDKVARVIDNPNNPGIGMLAYQDDTAVISPLDKVSITTSTNPYQIDAEPGKWYEILCSQSSAQSWHIYLEANSTVTTDTVHTIVRIGRVDSAVSCSPELVWHDERGVVHYEQCDLTGTTSYYDFDCLVRNNGYTVSGTPWSFARVRKL